LSWTNQAQVIAGLIADGFFRKNQWACVGFPYRHGVQARGSPSGLVAVQFLCGHDKLLTLKEYSK
jgi:hypothetical protein